MTSFTEIYNSTKPTISFEIFPPRTDEKIADTKNLLKNLHSLEPSYITVTYRALGKSRERSFELVRYLHQDLKAIAVAHMTCLGQGKKELKDIFTNLFEAGINNFLALRGDKIEGKEVEEIEVLSNARDFTSFLKEINSSVSIATAGYPETHPDALNQEEEISYLKEKISSGSEAILTQLFFNTDTYFDYVSKIRKAGISEPVVPGIMPIKNYAQLSKFVQMCGAVIPEELEKELSKIKEKPKQVEDFGTEYAIQMCKKLIRGGAPGVHLYTLNKADQVMKIVRALNS